MMTYIADAISLAIDVPKCVGCGLCEIVCPHQLLEVTFGKAKIMNKEKCIECGACQSNCPVGAITVNAGTGCAVAVLNTKQ